MAKVDEFWNKFVEQGKFDVFKTQLNRNLTNLKISVNSKLKQLSEGKKKINFLETNDHLSALGRDAHLVIDVSRENSESKHDQISELLDKQSSGDMKQDTLINFGSTDSIQEIKVPHKLVPKKPNVPDLNIAVQRASEESSGGSTHLYY